MLQPHIWIDACERWILDGLIEGCTPFYVNITFGRFSGGDEAIVRQMHRAIENGIYGQFCTRFCRHPRAASEQDKLPRLLLLPDLPVRKNGEFARVLDINAGGRHFNGPLLIPAGTKFKGDVAKHIMLDQRYARHGIHQNLCGRDHPRSFYDIQLHSENHRFRKGRLGRHSDSATRALRAMFFHYAVVTARTDGARVSKPVQSFAGGCG